MAVDKDTVAGIAKLARIKVDDAEQEALTKELSNILGWIDELGELDTEGVQPMTSVVEVQHSLRKDVIKDGDRQDDILKNAPESKQGYFVVPRVVE
ncbi:Asp-tRNA(Asn)/Glu-tRNA(Gln) amidotransferase GatCAB subunit C [Rhodovibrio sodomensis]|uniref:Aspartyl/glutamyl-tRNA(Asn/Gln) amidotransferase subunit C n=1 Tax=Rhodovibrio sodomensis TaxID=1088 RepID=A0ABS1D9R1_9PROT|nr:Asp-tRNA(Asn)/Glu-tRNA(Gln) amidotransferase subunit GatC [Rhodovibrio sodomensis]MBK1667156.1 Asp-tRNA(Asn)/Glu-tRNA(Gln) amidotransferase GatCAB subunit C [Rhodovibrio sodomensis]